MYVCMCESTNVRTFCSFVFSFPFLGRVEEGQNNKEKINKLKTTPLNDFTLILYLRIYTINKMAIIDHNQLPNLWT